VHKHNRREPETPQLAGPTLVTGPQGDPECLENRGKACAAADEEEGGRRRWEEEQGAARVANLQQRRPCPFLRAAHGEAFEGRGQFAGGVDADPECDSALFVVCERGDGGVVSYGGLSIHLLCSGARKGD
jgi:hypothetical protein